MTVAQPSERHLSRDGLREYLEAGAPAIIRVDGEPIAFLVISPVAGRLSMRFPEDHSQVPDLSPYRHFSADRIAWEDQLWVELTLDGADLLDTYPVLCAVADRVQLGGSDFALAVREVIASFHELLTSVGRLNEQQELGLFGELLMVRHLLEGMSEMDVMLSWRGPTAEEHDFGLNADDVELKATTSETRRHWINDLEQLTPSVGRRLWLVSVQLTAGGVSGSTLHELVASIRSRLVEPTAQLEYEQRLAGAGWRDEQSGLYRRRFQQRSYPGLFEITGTFPTLTTATLVAAGLDPVHFPKVTYMLDLSGVPEGADPPVVIADFMKTGGR